MELIGTGKKNKAIGTHRSQAVLALNVPNVLLNFSDRTRTGVLTKLWSLVITNSLKSNLILIP